MHADNFRRPLSLPISSPHLYGAKRVGRHVVSLTPDAALSSCSPQTRPPPSTTSQSNSPRRAPRSWRATIQLFEELAESAEGEARERMLTDLEDSLLAHMAFEEEHVHPLVASASPGAARWTATNSPTRSLSPVDLASGVGRRRRPEPRHALAAILPGRGGGVDLGNAQTAESPPIRVQAAHPNQRTPAAPPLWARSERPAVREPARATARPTVW